MMATMCKLQYLLIIGICLRLRFSCGFSHELPYNGVKIITYGEPCPPTNYLPVTIEEPVLEPVSGDLSTPSNLPTSCTNEPLKLNYRVIVDKPPIPYQSQATYPVSIQVPEVPEISKLPKVVVESLEIIKSDPYRGKSYLYNTQSLPSPSVPILKSYNVDLHVPPISPPSTSNGTPTQSQCVSIPLTGLTSRIDKVIIPACESPTKCTCQV